MENIGHKTKGDNSPIQGDINTNEIMFHVAPPKIETNKEIDEIRSSVEKINKEIDKIKIQEKQNNPYIMIFVITLFAIAVIFFFIFLRDNYKFYISNENIILVFIGILATFIVVSNYMQVNNIERKINNSISITDKQYKEVSNNVNFLDEYIDGIMAYFQSITLLNDINKDSYIESYRQITNALYHFANSSKYRTVGTNIEQCLKIARIIAPKIKNNNSLSENSSFQWVIEEIKKLETKEFTKELKKQFFEIENVRKS